MKNRIPDVDRDQARRGYDTLESEKWRSMISAQALRGGPPNVLWLSRLLRSPAGQSGT